MNLYQVFSIFRQSAGMCIILNAIVLLLYVLDHKGIYGHCMDGHKRLGLRGALCLAIYCSYLIVVLNATLILREVHEGFLVKMGLLATYRKAWNSFLLKDYSLFLLNIIMFIPIGVLSPMVMKKCRKGFVCYLLGMLLTIIIEAEQYITRRGLFEIPDIVHNELGCMIGYGFWRVGTVICARRNHVGTRKWKKEKILCYQLPLLFTIGLFASIFGFYYAKELGNLSTAYTRRMDMSHITLCTKVSFDNQQKQEMVYKGKIGKKKDTIRVANAMFEVHNTTVDETETKSFDIVDIYTSKDGKYICYVYYKGNRIWFIDLSVRDEKMIKPNYSIEEIRELLKPYAIDIPDTAWVGMREDGQFEVQVALTKEGNEYIEGDIYGYMNKEKELIMFHDNLLHLKEYKEFPIISKADAYKEIQKGKFQLEAKKKYHKIIIEKVELKRLLDSKGYYQPVYDFSVSTENEKGHIYIGAIQ